MPQRIRKPILGIPENLQQLLAGDQTGYQLKTVHSLELVHGLMGFFPAIVRTHEGVVFTLNPTLLKEVWEILEPRLSKMNSNLFYVNEKLMVGFPIHGASAFDLKRSQPERILARAEFNGLMAVDPHPFEWASGLINESMDRKSFLELIRASTELARASAEASRVNLPA